MVFINWFLDTMWMGASMIKWTTLDPCTCLRESDSKQYTNFEFFSTRDHKQLKKYWSTRSSNLCWQKHSKKKSTYYKGQWMRWCWTSDYQFFCWKHDKITLKWRFCAKILDLKCMKKKKVKFKIVKVMKLMSKISSSHMLLSITFKDKFWRSHLEFLCLST